MQLLTYVYILTLSNASTLSQLQGLFRTISDHISLSTGSDISQPITADFVSSLSAVCDDNLAAEQELELEFCAVPDMTKFIASSPSDEVIISATGLGKDDANVFQIELPSLGSVWVQPADPNLPCILIPQSYLIMTKAFSWLANDVYSSIIEGSTLIQNYDAYSYILQGADEIMGADILRKTRAQIYHDYQDVDQYCAAPSLPILPFDFAKSVLPGFFNIDADSKSASEIILGHKRFTPTDSCSSVPVVNCDGKRDLLAHRGYRPMCNYKSKSSLAELVTFEDTSAFNYNLVLNVLNSWLKIINQKFTGGKQHETIRLVLGLSSVRKQFPNIGEDFTFSAINSAFYCHYANVPLIFMYRREEFLKVMLHEVLHAALPSDNDLSNAEGLGRRHTAETFVETIATLGNCVVQSKLGGVSVSQCLHAERKFSLLQAAKIILISGFQTYEEFLENVPKQDVVKGLPDTVEYHIYKSATLCGLERFMEIAVQHWEHLEHLDKYIIERIYDPAFASDVNSAIAVVKKMQENPAVYGPLLATGRMTISEIPIDAI